MKKLSLVLIAVFLFSSMSFAMGPAKPGGKPGIHDGGDKLLSSSRVLRLADELKLTDAQIKKIRDLKDNSKREVADLRHEIKKAMWDIQDEMKKKKPGKGAIDKAIDKISGNQKQLMKIRVNQMLEIKSILTADQFTKLTTAIEHGKKKTKKKIFDRFRK